MTDNPNETKKVNKYYKYQRKPPTCVDCGLFMPSEFGQRKRCPDCAHKKDIERQVASHKKKRLEESPLKEKKCKRCGEKFQTRSKRVVNCCKKQEKKCSKCNASITGRGVRYCRDCAKTNYLKKIQDYHANNRKRVARPDRYVKKECKVCKAEFESYQGIAIYCTPCRQEVYYKQMTDSAKRIKANIRRRPYHNRQKGQQENA